MVFASIIRWIAYIAFTDHHTSFTNHTDPCYHSLTPKTI